MINIFKKAFLVISCLFILFCLYSLGKVYISNDITVEPISPIANPDLVTTGYNHRLPVYLISYAHGGEMWFKNQNALALSAFNKGIDVIINYKRSHLSPEFMEKNEFIMSQPVGGGYWVWKPYIILKTLKEIPENSILLYADSATIFKKSITEVIKNTKDHDIILCEYDPALSGKVERCVKRDALVKTGCDTPACRNSPHFWAGFIIMKNTPRTRAFIQHWLEYCQQPDLVMEAPEVLPKYPDYGHHQHDEALLCINYAKHPQGILALPFKEYSFLKERVRKPGKEYVSAYEWMNKNIRGIDKSILNSQIMQSLRKLILE